jgi:ABC-type uncharacterized transport system ATPase component
MQASASGQGSSGPIIKQGGFGGSAMSGTIDGAKASLGGSVNLTYSTLANVPKAKRQKLIAEAKPMVTLSLPFNINKARWGKEK